MNTNPESVAEHGFGVPPEVYDVAVGWDARPEIDRLLHLARQAGVPVASALELGCATGRLLEPLAAIVPDVCGLELSPALAEYARGRCAAEIAVGDMTDFDLDRRFDLIFTSANTIRHALADDAVENMWRCIRKHLNSGGVFIADLELGFDAEVLKVGKPTSWEIARGGLVVRASWLVKAPPSPSTRCCEIEYTFKILGEKSRTWREHFNLRTYDAAEFQARATEAADLTPMGLHENREPYLLETPPEKAVGRCLAVFQRLTNT